MHFTQYVFGRLIGFGNSLSPELYQAISCTNTDSRTMTHPPEQTSSTCESTYKQFSP